MTEEQRRTALKFETAKQIRTLLDTARKSYGAEQYDADDIETAILELVTEED